jgi:nicotinate phosphoribosyltransferase
MVKSLLDSDWYKIMMAQMVYFHFRDWKVKYKFINRGGDVFPTNFDNVLWQELVGLNLLSLTDKEEQWLRKQPGIYPEFVDWFRKYSFELSELTMTTDNNGGLELDIEGDWLRTIFWEVPLLATISELYYKEENCLCEGTVLIDHLLKKKDLMKFPVVDFGTRRRFSSEVHEKVIRMMMVRQFKEDVTGNNPYFIGTSNPYMAMKYGLPVVGTYAHEAVMAMQVGSLKTSNYHWYSLWRQLYGKLNSIALSDTLTTDYFFKTMPALELRLMDGIRQDSGNPILIGHRIVEEWKKLGINPKDKKIIFSDNLNAETALNIYNLFKVITNPVFGIGTNLTNDCGYKHLNMVIKLDEVNGKKVVKISDDIGKYTGDQHRIEEVLEEIKNG